MIPSSSGGCTRPSSGSANSVEEGAVHRVVCDGGLLIAADVGEGCR
jgi:hypothetical protein